MKKGKTNTTIIAGHPRPLNSLDTVMLSSSSCFALVTLQVVTVTKVLPLSLFHVALSRSPLRGCWRIIF
jgi:hypothetical protein